MNTGNKGEIPRRWSLAIFMLIFIFLFDMNCAHAEKLEEKLPPKIEVKTYVEERIDSVKETKKCIQRQAEEKARLKKLEQKRRAKMKREAHWKPLGECRITEYCPDCNDPPGTHLSSSGAYLYEGCVACSWLENGTRLRIDGCEYVVMDTCGTEAIDIFRDTSYCCCNRNYYAEVEIWR